MVTSLRSVKHLSSVLLGLGLVACGGDDDTASSSDPATLAGDPMADPDDPMLQGEAEGSVDVEAQANFVCNGCPEGSVVDFGACGSNRSSAELNSRLQLALDTEHSIHELISCGGLTVQVAFELVSGLVSMVVDPDGELLPKGLEYQGEGLYLSEGSSTGSMRMQVWLFEESDGELTLIEDDLFDRSTYLVGAKTELVGGADVDIDPSDPFSSSVSADAKLQVRYEEAGRWVKLTGLGDPPPNPLVISVDMLSKLKPRLGSIRLQSEVEVEDVRGDSVIRYHVKTPVMKLEEMVSFSLVEFELIELSAKNETLGQEFSLSAWDLAYSGGHNLDGSMEFSVSGELAYQGSVSYENSSTGSLEVSCK